MKEPSWRVAMRAEAFPDEGITYYVSWENYDGAEYEGRTIENAVKRMVYDSRKHGLGPYGENYDES